MNNVDFVEKAKQIEKLNTVYGWGTFGQKLTYSLIDYKAKQYPRWYNSSKNRQLRALVGRGYFAIDCIGLIKGIHWGFPNIQYASNGMPDTNANGYIKQCNDVSSNFDNIVLGEVVWMNGHIGIYAGVINGVKMVIESSPSWKNGVQWTKLSQRKWLKHGKMPQVSYGKKTGPIKTPTDNKLDVDGSWGPSVNKALQRYFELGIVDGIISEPYSNLVAALQKALGVPITGAMNTRTTKALQKHLGTSQDGVISKPKSLMVEELQRALNGGYLNLKGEKDIVAVIPPKPVAPPKKPQITGDLDEETIREWQIAWKMKYTDGKISKPKSELIEELQRRLRDGKM